MYSLQNLILVALAGVEFTNCTRKAAYLRSVMPTFPRKSNVVIVRLFVTALCKISASLSSSLLPVKSSTHKLHAGLASNVAAVAAEAVPSLHEMT